jgi:hypothetical protein
MRLIIRKSECRDISYRPFRIKPAEASSGRWVHANQEKKTHVCRIMLNACIYCVLLCLSRVLLLGTKASKKLCMKK